ncbi:DUF4158 domain-containing protein [Saccharopolyspora sp. NPDC050389]|uniref:DUF4158 domain-containing protein n=1 Tax=Saccharopolyspora sp. NPDC050389 TaxID=3155516 RepID=UPI0033FBCDE6
MTSIERTAYPRFKQLISAHELHLFFAPSREEAAWAAESTHSEGHQLALLLALKSYQRMGRFPKPEEYPAAVVDFVLRAVELPEGTVLPTLADKTAKNHRSLVRRRLDARYEPARAREVAEEAIRAAAASKNRPADLINIGLEKVVEAGLEIPGFSMLDRAAARIRAEVNGSLFARLHERMGAGGSQRMAALLDNRLSDGTTEHNCLKKPAKSPTWSHFRQQKDQLIWVDGLGPTAEWLDGVAAAKVNDFAGEAEAADAPGMRDYEPIKRAALLACLVRKAQMRARDDLTAMFTKRVALQVKRAKAELAELHEKQQAMVEALIVNYRTLLQHVDADGPAQQAKAKAGQLSAEVLNVLAGIEVDAGARQVAARFGGAVAPALHSLAAAVTTQAGGLSAVLRAVDSFGGFDGQYEQIEKVSAHHGDYWEVLLYGHLRKDRAVMYDFAKLVELVSTTDDTKVLDALEHARRHKLTRDFIPDTNAEGKELDVSFATKNWQKAIRDKNRPDRFVRRHFEAMVFHALAEACGPEMWPWPAPRSTPTGTTSCSP